MEWLAVLTQGMSKEQVKGAAMLSWRLVLVFQVMWVWGWLAPLGIPAPFAKASLQVDVNSIVSELRGDRIDRLETDIFSARRQQCTAIKEGTGEQQRQYGDRLNELIKKYRMLTDSYPRIPGCDEV